MLVFGFPEIDISTAVSETCVDHDTVYSKKISNTQ